MLPCQFHSVSLFFSMKKTRIGWQMVNCNQNRFDLLQIIVRMWSIFGHNLIIDEIELWVQYLHFKKFRGSVSEGGLSATALVPAFIKKRVHFINNFMAIWKSFRLSIALHHRRVDTLPTSWLAISLSDCHCAWLGFCYIHVISSTYF